MVWRVLTFHRSSKLSNRARSRGRLEKMMPLTILINHVVKAREPAGEDKAKRQTPHEAPSVRGGSSL